MKKIITFIILLSIGATNLFSQTLGYDINILIKEKVKIIDISNDTLVYQEFLLKEKNKYLKKEISFDKNGFLKEKLEVSGINRDSNFIFIFKNTKDRNPPIIFKKEKIKNILIYPKDFENIGNRKLRELLNKAKNIYIIETHLISKYYVLKKVTLKDRLVGL